MLVAGQLIPLQIEKPAAGGAMIARVDGQVVLVSGAIPGERVVARITRVGTGVAHADTVTVDEPSPDRVASLDALCGGCRYAHIAYERQLEIKALVIADAFARIGRAPLTAPVAVAPSPVQGYRMRARLHRRGGRLGFFREGTHELCDARPTGQLRPATCDILDRLGDELARLGADEISEVEMAENVEGAELVVHLHTTHGSPQMRDTPSSLAGVTGVTISAHPGGCRILSGRAHVTDRVDLGALGPSGHAGAGGVIAVRRHVLAFFQGNRFLLRDLVAHVVEQIPAASSVIDLYAGGGLFALAAAGACRAQVTAVEGDRVAAEDLVANAVSVEGVVAALHQPVEEFVRSAPRGADVVIVDPPRTGMSRDALDGVVRLGPRRLIYVSCDVATLARDARRFIDGGYHVANVRAFDLFPNTPHVETVGVFEK